MVQLRVLLLSILCIFFSAFFFTHNFGAAISVSDQKEFSQKYIKTILSHSEVCLLFDCRKLTTVEPAAIWAHVEQFRAIREYNRRAVAGFAILMSSDVLRNILNMIFRLVPPSAPYLVTSKPDVAVSYVLEQWAIKHGITRQSLNGDSVPN